MKKLICLILTCITFCLPLEAWATDNQEKRYSAEELMKGSDNLDDYREELQIIQIGVRETKNCLFVGVRNLTEYKKDRIKEISGIENIEFKEVTDKDIWENEPKSDYNIIEEVSSYKNESVEISFIPNESYITISGFNGTVTKEKIPESFSFINEKDVTYINPQYLSDLIQEKAFKFKA